MPLLLEEDATRKLPQMYRVRQKFDNTHVEDIEGVTRQQMRKEEIASRVKPGMKIAVGVGSRGIHNEARVVRTIIEELKAMGAEPFIIGAMGSHGAGTLEGQMEILHTYGITEEDMGCPVITNNDVEFIGETTKGIGIYFDSIALHDVDMVIPVNRVKLHTDFADSIQSGLCKMLVIGFGHHRGCSSVHMADFSYFGDTLREGATMIMQKAPVGFGFAIMENAYDDTLLLETIPAENFIAREAELVEVAKKNMPFIRIPEIDILEVEQIGKDISGNGYDPNILGKSYLLDKYVLPVPKIERMIVLDTSPGTHGNPSGIGIFDITTKKLWDHVDLEPMYANDIALGCIEGSKIPLIAADEAEALRIGIKVLRHNEPGKLKIVKIKDTLHLSEIQVSEDLLPVVEADPNLELIGPADPIE